jgi:hypothetical protein
MSIDLSIAKRSLYETCQLRANGWNKGGMEQWGNKYKSTAAKSVKQAICNSTLLFARDLS